MMHAGLAWYGMAWRTCLRFRSLGSRSAGNAGANIASSVESVRFGGPKKSRELFLTLSDDDDVSRDTDSLALMLRPNFLPGVMSERVSE